MLHNLRSRRNVILTLLLVGLASVLIFEVISLGMERNELVELRQENAQFRSMLGQIRERIDTAWGVMDTLDDRMFALRSIAGVDIPPGEYRTMGMGGHLEEPLEPLVKEFADADAEVERLLRFSSFQLRSLLDLEKDLKENAHVRDHTPSIRPCDGYYSSGYGYRIDPFTGQRRFHRGLDICAPIGTPIVAPAAGSVASVKWNGGLGLTLKIDHGNDLVTRYCHCSRVLVKRDQEVVRGEIIAYVGESGKSTGPHLHYEVWADGKTVNPWQYIIPESAYYD
jgi:murein DD-endopeptidase MepM/ murein hydrolase activator NlpD